MRHVWHADDGFRKCTICNKAIQEATGNYLVFFDGDCIPGRHCLEIHVDLPAVTATWRAARYT